MSIISKLYSISLTGLPSVRIIRRHTDLFCLPACVHMLELLGGWCRGGFLQTVFMPVPKGALLIVAGFVDRSVCCILSPIKGASF